MKKYEIISHTADIGLCVFGRDLEELFCNAAEGMMRLMLEDLSRVIPDEIVEIKASGLSKEELLVSWLSELLYKLTVEHWLGVKAEISFPGKKENKFFLQAKIKGQKIDYKSIPLKREIKAVTYHNLEIKKTEDGYRTEIIFDV